MNASVKDTIREHILETCLYGAPPEELDDDASFLETGVLDSTGVMELILFVEEEFGVTVEDDEIVPENLDSVQCLCRYVERKRNGVPSP